MPTRDQDPAQGAQRRLASLRAQLLPALSPGGAPCGACRYVDKPCRFPLHRPGLAAPWVVKPAIRVLHRQIGATYIAVPSILQLMSRAHAEKTQSLGLISSDIDLV